MVSTKRDRRPWKLAWAAPLALAASAALHGCAPESGSSPCEPETLEACSCDDGRVGLRTCLEDGAWTVCRCGSGGDEGDGWPGSDDPEAPGDAPPATDPPAGDDDPSSPCVPDCEGRECGGDGCGGTCGPGCGEGGRCDVPTGRCSCSPDCGERQCGLDPVCGTLSCGECGPDERCSDEGICECARGACGEACCADGQVCLFDETCCTPDCAGRECGDDGCGGSCAPGCGAGEICAWATGECVTSCSCDFYGGYCEPDLPGSLAPCGCDADCVAGTPCSSDTVCDPWCPTDTDPDCYCSCDYNEYCEAASYGSTDPCRCDEACEPHELPCEDDGHCDTWCPAGVDPDCGRDPCRERDVRVGRRYGSELLLEGSYAAPDPDEGALWALLSRGAAEGVGQLVVAMAAEHVSCVDSLEIVVSGYDDSGGAGAEVRLYNWETYASEPLPGLRVGPTATEHSGATSDPMPYLLCETGARPMCFVHAEVVADAAARTHVAWVEAWVHVSPP